MPQLEEDHGNVVHHPIFIVMWYNFWRTVCQGGWIGRGGPRVQPPRFLDLTPLHYFGGGGKIW